MFGNDMEISGESAEEPSDVSRRLTMEPTSLYLLRGYKQIIQHLFCRSSIDAGRIQIQA
jgi:hypothetical protein